MKYFVLYLFFIVGFCQSQVKSISSLINLVENGKDDTIKVKRLNLLCELFTNDGNTDSALIYGNTSLKLALKLNFKRGISTACSGLGVALFDVHNYSEAMNYHQKALKIDEAIGNLKDIPVHLANIGKAYLEQNNQQQGLDYYMRALKLIEQSGSK